MATVTSMSSLWPPAASDLRVAQFIYKPTSRPAQRTNPSYGLGGNALKQLREEGCSAGSLGSRRYMDKTWTILNNAAPTPSKHSKPRHLNALARFPTFSITTAHNATSADCPPSLRRPRTRGPRRRNPILRGIVGSHPLVTPPLARAPRRLDIVFECQCFHLAWVLPSLAPRASPKRIQAKRWCRGTQESQNGDEPLTWRHRSAGGQQEAARGTIGLRCRDLRYTSPYATRPKGTQGPALHQLWEYEIRVPVMPISTATCRAHPSNCPSYVTVSIPTT
ncbi:hypothetical protein BD779DRAFT_1472425 [Infundibulicybe gibba]|nr:hypothetical protein BD779DRAFT_1472425 [Infundibulicybe gibba]